MTHISPLDFVDGATFTIIFVICNEVWVEFEQLTTAYLLKQDTMESWHRKIKIKQNLEKCNINGRLD